MIFVLFPVIVVLFIKRVFAPIIEKPESINIKNECGAFGSNSTSFLLTKNELIERFYAAPLR